MQRFGLQEIHASGLEHIYSLAQVTVANLPSKYLWKLRNVPAMRPQQPAPPASSTVNITNHGSINVLQTGPGSTAHVQQQWITGDTTALQSALATLRGALEHAQGLEAETQRELVADIDHARAELREEKPNREKLLRWLGRIGAVVGAVASVQPAYEAVKAVALTLGIHIP
jgi:hypothetical protein